MFPRSWRLPIFILILEIFGFAYLLRLDSQKNNDGFYNYYKNVPVIDVVIDKKNENINKIITDYTGKMPGDYAVYIKDLKNGREFKFNDEKIFSSASIYKLAILNEVYSQIQKGTLSKDDELTASQADLDKRLMSDADIHGDNEEEGQSLGDGEVSYTVDYATQLMIRISDNYSALMLADRVGWKNAETGLRAVGIEDFDLTSENAPAVNARSVGQLLEKMYFGQAVSADSSAQMVSLLKDQQVNDRIPSLLPDGVVIAHKTGELDNLRHDAGIVFGQRTDYVIVLMTDTGDALATVDNMADFSKNIYDELEN